MNQPAIPDAATLRAIRQANKAELSYLDDLKRYQQIGPELHELDHDLGKCDNTLLRLGSQPMGVERESSTALNVYELTQHDRQQLVSLKETLTQELSDLRARLRSFDIFL